LANGSYAPKTDSSMSSSAPDGSLGVLSFSDDLVEIFYKPDGARHRQLKGLFRLRPVLVLRHKA
jgi:hypothetical protein